MQLNTLTAISPIDGRYRSKTQGLATYFSEYGLIRYRVKVEVAYFIALCDLPLPQLAAFDKKHYVTLHELADEFTEADAQAIKDIERTTNHDVKAVEYFIKQKMEAAGLGEWKEFVHFGLTSQDINNTAIPLSIKEYLHHAYLPQLNALVGKMAEQAHAWQAVPMLARTHGQPASPTRLGKEWLVFVERLQNQIELLKALPIAAKFGGATGNMNAHAVAYPAIDWRQFATQFVEKELGLKRLQTTTQIEHYDYLAALFDNLKRINTILLDFSKDVWQYISMEFFKQQVVAGEVGSSAMPHKVNPIDFENAEGNLGIANALLEHLSAKLPVSRLQRDLTDSTVLRNVGVPFAHTAIAFESLQKGLNKIVLNESAIQQELENNWMVVAEGIQTILRRENYPAPYEALKALTRGAAQIGKAEMHAFIDALQVSDAIKLELKRITPHNYTGV